MDETESDEALLVAFRQGRAEAFEILVQRHRARVFQYLLRFTGNRALAEDLLQETWLRVLRGADSESASRRFHAWLYTVARNLCVDSARRERHRPVERLPTPDPQGEGTGGGKEPRSEEHGSPDRQAHGARIRPLLEASLAALPEEQREVFVLREYCGVTFKEIAAVTAVPENTVKSRMRYALEGLRKQLEARGVDGSWDAAERTVTG